MRKWWILLLLVCFIARASGAVEYVHTLEHEQAQAGTALASKGKSGNAGTLGAGECGICATLKLTFVGAGWVPLLVLLGLWVGFVGMVRLQSVSQQSLRGIESRGPPA